MSLKGKVALVTGSGTGIGRAVAIDLAKKGASVVVNYSKSEKEAHQTCEEIKNLGVDCMVYQAEVNDDGQVRKMINAVVEHFGQLDILVNNAGVTSFVAHDDLEGLKEEHWDQVMDVNVKGLFFTCRAAAEELKKNKGCIVNITSVAGLTGRGSSIAYSASKAAAVSVTKSLARVLAPEVRVNSVAPGVVLTRWMDGQDAFVEKHSKRTPLQRTAQPEDVSEVVLSLISGASFVTGQTVVVDGGNYI
ncbi:SDR family NAD(P)-dependent oxidoreductase [Halobacillus amylolyticus]|uniref:Glucose 1-dehydrogenase n=1 Tax=Halobacillus amylolyticus TaxID=2932259 RepID=A0ABY4HBR8_9BACI|nr:glucose 1-dehydrogenase [Halobacillus amylolyticus]UOR11370.1 glucose 1-dehydrogenase [Halobacillus amylolyticus]